MVEEARYRTNGITLVVSSHHPQAKASYPPAVLLPGMGDTAGYWGPVAADLSRDRVVHAVDLRGHGNSEWPGSYSIDLMADDLLGLLPQLAAQVDLIGHSLGGVVACRALAVGARWVRRLVLEDVGQLRPRPPAARQRPEGDLDFDWAVIEQVRPEIDRPAAHWPETLSGIRVPTLAIGGGQRSFLPQERVAELVATVQDGRQVTIDAGHNVHVAEPAEFVRAVRTFLDEGRRDEGARA